MTHTAMPWNDPAYGCSSPLSSFKHKLHKLRSEDGPSCFVPLGLAALHELRLVPHNLRVDPGPHH
eukprot:45739-Eustigmatos_ZCMA.PRE.1